MKSLLADIRKCDHCRTQLPLGPNPIVAAHVRSGIAIIGQAPGHRVHQTGIPWDDPSGRQLRQWLEVSDSEFYDPRCFALVPMGFCYPGKGQSGDRPPRPECAPLWHPSLLGAMPALKLVILVGTYAQGYYLKERKKGNLTATVRAFKEYLPAYFPLPHPSPRNRFWLSKNPWFETGVLPELKRNIRSILAGSSQ